MFFFLSFLISCTRFGARTSPPWPINSINWYSNRWWCLHKAAQLAISWDRYSETTLYCILGIVMRQMQLWRYMYAAGHLSVRTIHANWHTGRRLWPSWSQSPASPTPPSPPPRAVASITGELKQHSLRDSAINSNRRVHSRPRCLPVSIFFWRQNKANVSHRQSRWWLSKKDARQRGKVRSCDKSERPGHYWKAKHFSVHSNVFEHYDEFSVGNDFNFTGMEWFNIGDHRSVWM